MDQSSRDSEFERANAFLVSAMNQITEDGVGESEYYLRMLLSNFQSILRHAYINHGRILAYQDEQAQVLVPIPDLMRERHDRMAGAPTATEMRFGRTTVLSIHLRRADPQSPWFIVEPHHGPSVSFCTEGIHSLACPVPFPDPAYPRSGFLRIAKGQHDWGRSYYRVPGFNYRVKDTAGLAFDSEPIIRQLESLGVAPGEWYTVSFEEVRPEVARS